MKKITFLLYIVILVLFGCEKDETRVKLNAADDVTPPAITSQVDGFTKTITGETLADEIEFAWEETGYGIATQVTYTLEADSECGTFTDPIVIVTTSENDVTMTLGDFNTKLISILKIAPFQTSTVQLRVTSTINGDRLSISDIVSINVIPWSDKPAGLWIGENPTAPVLYNKSGSVYEGYRYLDGNETSFRFASNPVCGEVVFGASGTAGVLAKGSGSAEIDVTDAGYYKFKVDTTNLTYEIIKINTWGLIGTSTPGGWDSSTPMEYNPGNDTWEAELNLFNGALKFRANNDWGINYGVENVTAGSGKLVFDAAAADIAEAGLYKVVIDFSQTASPYDAFTYSITPLSDVPVPAALYLPGGYQDYKPDLAPKIYATGADTYEGYVYISSNTGFKFTSAPDWGHTNYGDAGTAGNLSTDGAAPDISINGGYYKFNVNTAALTYTATLIDSWGLIGTATSGAWDNSTPMTFDSENNVWTATADLVVGALKFRANNGWAVNYGVSDSNSLDGNLIFDASAAVDIKSDGNYTITLDFSRSELPYKYTYKVVKN